MRLFRSSEAKIQGRLRQQRFMPLAEVDIRDAAAYLRYTVNGLHTRKELRHGGEPVYVKEFGTGWEPPPLKSVFIKADDGTTYLLAYPGFGAPDLKVTRPGQRPVIAREQESHTRPIQNAELFDEFRRIKAEMEARMAQLPKITVAQPAPSENPEAAQRKWVRVSRREPAPA